LAAWGSVVKTNAILADIYDVLSLINANLCAIGSGKRAKQPAKYSRPGDNNKQKIGKNALPPDALRAWFDRKRNERVKSKEREANLSD
jgi:hypothetical protein